METRVALVIEDEPQIANLVIAAFARFGIDAFSIETVAEAIEIIDGSRNIGFLFINLNHESDELCLVETVARKWPSIKVILMSDHHERLRELPPVIFVAKPTTASALVAVIELVAESIASNLE